MCFQPNFGTIDYVRLVLLRKEHSFASKIATIVKL